MKNSALKLFLLAFVISICNISYSQFVVSDSSPYTGGPLRHIDDLTTNGVLKSDKQLYVSFAQPFPAIPVDLGIFEHFEPTDPRLERSFIIRAEQGGFKLISQHDLPCYANGSTMPEGDITFSVPSVSQLNCQYTELDALTIKNGNGNVGIGTLSPSKLLHVAGKGKFDDKLTIGDYTLPKVDGLNGNTLVTDGSGTVSWSSFAFPISTGSIGQFLMYGSEGQTVWTDPPTDNLGNHTATQNIQTQGNWISHGGANEGIFINPTGQVGIGTNNIEPTAPYQLWVAGGIITEELRVALSTTTLWPDYVFTKDYPLKTLPEIESFIDKNGHLPDVPSAKKVVENGIDVSEMNAVLLKKVEELTLHMIALQKQIVELKDSSNHKN